MGKYVYIYYAGSASDGGNAEEWGKWFGELGDKLVDGGNPFAEGGKAVNKDGVMEVHNPPATGYSIVSADSMDDAVKLSKGCPLLSSKDGAVCVYEALPM
ncbi:MAG TPA: hypothetical protein VK694_03655 [Verrucomicrobiae bacterium]|nr:hypothetical protein [Verrucomicrobiae bacterium]